MFISGKSLYNVKGLLLIIIRLIVNSCFFKLFLFNWQELRFKTNILGQNYMIMVSLGVKIFFQRLIYVYLNEFTV